MIRLVIADDHGILRDGIAQALQSLPDISVLGTAANGRQLLARVGEFQPDVLVVDVDMPEMGGLDALHQLQACPPAVVMSMHTGSAIRQRVIQSGAVGFLSKSAPLADLAAAVRAAAAGESFLTDQDLVLNRYRNPILDPGAASLTERERELLGCLASGATATDEIAARLYISPKTVKNHLANIYAKLGVSDRAQAVVEAVRLGLMS